MKESISVGECFEDTEGRPLPPWQAHPNIPRFSIGWRMGYGEYYLTNWWTWYQQQSEAEKKSYRICFPLPLRWWGFYDNAIFKNVVVFSLHWRATTLVLLPRVLPNAGRIERIGLHMAVWVTCFLGLAGSRNPIIRQSLDQGSDHLPRTLRPFGPFLVSVWLEALPDPARPAPANSSSQHREHAGTAQEANS